MNFDMSDLYGTAAGIGRIRRHASDFLNQFDGCLIALPKDGVFAVQMGAWATSSVMKNCEPLVSGPELA